MSVQKSDYKWLIDRWVKKYGENCVISHEGDYGTVLGIGVQIKIKEEVYRNAIPVEDWICSDPEKCYRHNPKYDEQGDLIYPPEGEKVPHTRYSLNADPGKDEIVQKFEYDFDKRIKVVA